MAFSFLDMFCGGGGSSEGARRAGGTLAGALDAWDIATKTLAANFDCGAIRTWRMWPNSRPLSDFPARVDLLIASPECTNHSPAKGSAPRSEESKDTAKYVLNYARGLKPRWIVVENVMQMRSWTGYAGLVTGLERQGYHVTPAVLDAASFGVPQTRRRLFLICDNQVRPEVPRPPANTVRQTARDVVRLDNTWASNPLNNGRRANATIKRFERGVASLGRNEPFLLVYYGSDGGGGWQSLDKPIRTLTTLDRFGLITWRSGEPFLRMLQVEELKAAMGFQPGYKLDFGSRRDRIRLLGNGVCPPVMEQVVRQLTNPQSEEYLIAEMVPAQSVEQFDLTLA